MKTILGKLSLICWSFIGVFINCLLVASLIPADFVWIVSAILGLAILTFLVYDLRKIYRCEGFDFGYFLTIKKGYWRMLFGLIGLGLLSFGLFVTIFPNLANELGEKHWLKIAKVLVILFWTALTLTFLSLEFICLSESTAFWRLQKKSEAGKSFGLAILWLLLALLFLSLFLEVINDIFFPLSATVQNWILGIFAVLSILLGLLSGKYENLKDFETEQTTS
jgi:hypothetical protein